MTNAPPFFPPHSFRTKKNLIQDFRSMVVFTKTALLLVCSVCATNGFAYAPNFITKIIKDDTGLEPIGLLTPTESVPLEVEKKATTPITQQQKVITRFPPEPNGYLHLGHAKAVSFNFAVARMFGGDCHMRLDDTNPSKEDEEYVASILEDVQWIQSGLVEPGKKAWSGSVRKTSDYFEHIYESAVSLIKSGNAYVDSLSADEMREYRGSLTVPGQDSPYRCRSIEENLNLFQGVSLHCYHVETVNFISQPNVRQKRSDARRNISRRDSHLTC